MADTISEETNDVPVPFQRAHDSVLLSWADPCKHIGFFHSSRESSILKHSNVASENNPLDLEAKLLANSSGYQLIIAGKNLQLYSSLFQERAVILWSFP